MNRRVSGYPFTYDELARMIGQFAPFAGGPLAPALVYMLLYRIENDPALSDAQKADLEGRVALAFPGVEPYRP